MAVVDNWEVEITGKGGHRAFPELAVDPVVAGVLRVMALHDCGAQHYPSTQCNLAFVDPHHNCRRLLAGRREHSTIDSSAG